MPEKNKNTYILDENTPILVAESYRKLRDNIIKMMPDARDSYNRIGFTGGGTGDGKTTVCINTALCLAETGRKIIVLDCNLHNSAVAKKLMLEERPGLSDIIAGRTKVMETIQHYGRIDIVTAGTKVKNPEDMLVSARMQSFLQRLSEVYDFVLIDLPSVMVSNEARSISDSVDGFVIVARRNRSDLMALKNAVSRMRRAKAEILGLVLTNASLEEKRHYKRIKRNTEITD